MAGDIVRRNGTDDFWKITSYYYTGIKGVGVELTLVRWNDTKRQWSATKEVLSAQVVEALYHKVDRLTAAIHGIIQTKQPPRPVQDAGFLTDEDYE